MDALNGGQIDKLLEDISSIKNVINKNKPLLKQVLDPAHFRLFTLLAAVGVIGFAMLIFFLMQHYGSFSAIPRTTRYVIFTAMAADFIFMQVLKRRTFLKTGKRIDPTFTFGRLLKEFFTDRIAHVYVPIMLLIIFLSIYFINKSVPHYIVPTGAIGIGLLYNFIGSLTDIRPYLMVGYWFLITGMGVLIFNNIPVPISISITFGCGLLIFSVLGRLAAGADKEE